MLEKMLDQQTFIITSLEDPASHKCFNAYLCKNNMSWACEHFVMLLMLNPVFALSRLLIIILGDNCATCANCAKFQWENFERGEQGMVL